MNKKEAEEILTIAREKGKTILDLENYIAMKEKEHKKAMYVLYYMLDYWRRES